MSRNDNVVLTGASDGIGAAAACTLAQRGCRLLLTGRRPDKLSAVADPLGAEWFAADFERLDEVRALAAWIRERTDRIDVLANNAGGVFAERVITVDGNERTMQVNHYAHFLLTSLLIDVLTESDAKVVNTSSVGAHVFGKIDMDDLDHADLHARYHDQGVGTVAFHPGNIASNSPAC